MDPTPPAAVSSDLRMYSFSGCSRSLESLPVEGLHRLCSGSHRCVQHRAWVAYVSQYIILALFCSYSDILFPFLLTPSAGVCSSIIALGKPPLPDHPSSGSVHCSVDKSWYPFPSGRLPWFVVMYSLSSVHFSPPNIKSHNIESRSDLSLLVYGRT